MLKRQAIPAATKLRLFADSSGYCQRPECLAPLFPLELGGIKHIAEMAHVLPHGETGPRHEERKNELIDPNSFENLILLCPKCHTIIDKNPEAYPRITLLEWKREHLANVCLKQGIKPYESRGEARQAVAQRLAENKAIWQKFAPVDGSEFDYNPEADVAELWELRVKSVILPNLYQIQSIIAANLHHATDAERQTYAEFREHVRGLTERHISGIAGRAIRFPEKMETILE